MRGNKTRILNHFCNDCQEQSDGKNTLLVFNEGLQKLLSTYYDEISENTKARNI